MDESDLNNNLNFAQEAFRERNFKLVDRCCSAVLESHPRNARANYLMGLVAIEVGIIEKAIRFFTTATQEDDSKEAYWGSLARSYLELDDVANASKTIEKAGTKGFVFHELASIVNGNGAKEKGDIKAKSEENITNVIKLYQAGRLSLALKKAEKLLDIYPRNLQLLTVCGASYAGLFDYEKAVLYFKKCLQIDSKNPDSNNNLALAYWNSGRDKDAEIYFKEAIKLRENFSEAHRHLSEIIDYRNEPTLLENLEVCLSDPNLSSEERAQLLFARAKAKRDLKEYSESFASYKEGNKLRKQLSKYNFESDRQLFHKIKSVAQELTEGIVIKDMDPSAPVPIFILGMPRSGTSLVEQILSSHSLVHGGGEVPFLRNLGGNLAVGVRAISSEELKRLNKEYLLKISSISNGRSYVTDKLPHNFLFIPLIMAALPRARIVHVKRDPVATCWSSFTQYFTTDGLSYSDDLDDLENYYLAYNDLLNHWDKIYSDKIYHCNYDSLVKNPASEIRNLLSFVNLEWEDKCLMPYANERQVNTASHSQVRSKIYKGSSKNWKKYEEFLRHDFKKLKKLSI